MIVEEVKLNKAVLAQLISLSRDWEKENSCHGYQKNTLDDIEGNRIFLAVEDDVVIGYLFGHKELLKKQPPSIREVQNTLKLRSCISSHHLEIMELGRCYFKISKE